MKFKSMLFIILIVVVMINFTACNTYTNEEKEIIDFIMEFYSIQYEAYSNFESCDLEPYLDMGKVQNQNKAIAFERMIIEHQHLDDMKYCYIDKQINPITYEINQITVSGTYASINIDLGLTKGKYYPGFVYEGENKFVLKSIDDKWKIVNHGYDGLIYFEKSDRELMSEIDEARIRKIIDNEYGRSPLLP